jgi:hypothetical protein
MGRYKRGDEDGRVETNLSQSCQLLESVVANVAMVRHRAMESAVDDQDPTFLFNPRFLVFWFKKNALRSLGDPQSTAGDKTQTAAHGQGHHQPACGINGNY